MYYSCAICPYQNLHNTHKDKWSINELLTVCVQEEKRLIMEQGEKVYLNAQEKKKRDQAKNKVKIPAQTVIKKESKCFFCK